MKLKSTKKVVLASVTAVFMASVLVASPIVQDNGVNIGEDVSAVQAVKIAAVTMQTTASLNVRSTASVKGKLLVTIPKGTKVKTDTKVGTWYKVSYKGKTGYVSGAYLKKVEVAETPTKTAPAPKSNQAQATPAPPSTVVAEKTYQTTANLNVRSTSSANGKLLVTIPKGKQVKSSQKQNGWFKVTYNNKTGWVSGTYLKEVKVVSSSTPPASTPKAVSTPAVNDSHKLMSMAQAEVHLSKHMTRFSHGFELVSKSGRDSVIVQFNANKTGKAVLSVDGVNYGSGNDIRPGDLGQDAYDSTKAHFAQMNNAIQAYADTQFGIGSKEANTLVAEVKKMSLTGRNGDSKTITLQGKSVTIVNQGVRTVVLY